MTAHSHLLQQYQQPLWGRLEPALRNCLAGAGIIGLVFIIMVWVVPIPQRKQVTVTEVPERLARLILEKPAARVAKSKPPESSRPDTRAPEPEAAPATAQPAPRTAPARRTEVPKVAVDRGVEGRTRATKDVTQNIANVTGSLDKVLDNIATQVPASRTSTNTKGSVDAPGSTRGRRGVRAGRNSTQLGSVGAVSGLSSADLAGSAIAGEGVSIAMITELAGGGTGAGGGSGAPGGSGGAGGSSAADAGPAGSTHRSNESLLAVVRRYAPGIQFCYDNELRQKPGLRGKLVVAMVVLANGTVSEATIVEDTLGSPGVRECALAQIRTWQFPAIPSGTTRFKTPFVFTPPSQ